MNSSHKNNSPHYTWGNNCDGWHLLDSPSLSVIHERMPPGTSETKHYHEKAQQFFFILAGTATFYFEDEVVHVNEKEGIHIPAQKIHQIKNESGDPIEFLVISEPATKEDRINN
jgi:mannose-6-phosphate isomerase-like protein (cupin superfamily)